MSGGFGLPSIDFSSLGQLGTTFRDARDRREAQALLGQQLDAALAVQGQPAQPQAPLSALGQQAPAAPTTTGRPLTFGATDGAMGDYLATTRAKESGGNDLAANPNSTAKGRYQFTDGTWKNVASRHPELGLQPGGWKDPAQQERAMAAFTADNAKALTAAGVPINPGNLYVSHFLGEAGGPKFIAGAMRNPDAPATAFVSPEAARANRTIFFNRDGTPKTAGQVYAERTGRFGGGAPTQVAQATPALPASASFRQIAAPTGALVPPAQRPVAFANNEEQVQAMEQAMGMLPGDAPVAQATAPVAANPQADMPAIDAIPAGFQIPGQAQQSDFQPGTVASPAIAQPSAAAPVSAPLSQAGAQRLNPAQVQNLRAMLANPQTQGYAAKIIEGLNKPDEFSFQVVGDQLVRTSKSGRAEVVPGINKPPTFSVTKGADGNDYVLNPQTGQLTRAIQGRSETYTDLVDPAARAAAGIPASYTGPAQRGPNGEIKLPGKAQTEVTVNPGEKAFKSAAGGGLAKRFQGISDEGDAGRTELALVGQLQSLADQIGTGTGAAATAKLAEYGIKVGPNVGKIEAYQSLVDKLTPSQRLPGAGATSDFDAKLFKSSLPRLINTPEGNALISNTLSALAKDKVDRAAIADLALIGPDEGGISPSEAVKRLRALPAPNLVFQAGLSELQKAGRLGSETPAPAARREIPTGTPARAALEAEARRRGLIP